MSATLSNYTHDELKAVVAEIKQIRAEQAKFFSIIAPLVTRKLPRAAQAKQAGCSTRTITRREKAAQHKMRIQGIL